MIQRRNALCVMHDAKLPTMIRPARATRDELLSKYGLSERLAVRVLALAAGGLGVTGAVLEEAARVPAVADAILSPEVLERGIGLDTAAVRRIGPGGQVLAVVDRILCLPGGVQGEGSVPAGKKLAARARGRAR